MKLLNGQENKVDCFLLFVTEDNLRFLFLTLSLPSFIFLAFSLTHNSSYFLSLSLAPKYLSLPLVLVKFSLLKKSPPLRFVSAIPE